VSFDLKNSGVVITGAGRGIGEALARQFASEGARLVLSDRDESVNQVAAELGAVAVVADAASEEGVAELVGAARSALGEIDMFCANAGIAPPDNLLDTPDEVWQQTWDVNVMTHVRAARALLPDWLERGRGHFLATVSGAALGTTLGRASYSVSKHGALAFSEWLLATYKHRGITVQAICPEGVRTQMLDAIPDKVKNLLAEAHILEPGELAEIVSRELSRGSFLILPDVKIADGYAFRATNTDEWLADMNEVQQMMEKL